VKLYARYFSKSQRLSSKTPTTRKLLSTATATLVLTAGLWVLILGKEKLQPHSEFVKPVELPAAIEQESEPAGLSRRRKDFDKALGILAAAASSDGQLTGYFSRVQKRVRGEAILPEKESRVRVVKRHKKAAGPLAVNELSTADTTVHVSSEGRIKNVWARLKGFFGEPKDGESRPGGDTQTASTADDRINAPAKANQEQAATATRLTVGDMKFETNSAIERWVNYYTASQGGRQTMQIGINRSKSYIDLAREEFRQRGVPEDLVWLAHVESVWHTTAVSPAAAGGLWQFIPSTATDYGLSVNEERDERLDPAKQTEVAAEYLRDLYTIFGDWELAMAAYNCGEPRVMNAIVKNGRANFWELHQKRLLPEETLNYVPKILAAITVAGSAEMYGFSHDDEAEASLATP
jgi:hypothetical protein